MERIAYRGADIFDGKTRRSGHALLLRGASIEAVLPEADMPAGVETRDLAGGLLAPGFVDVQVNGGGGVLLNERPMLDGVRAICEAHAPFGSTALLPTVITDAVEVTRAAIAAVEAAKAAGIPGCLGIHVEGPFISVAKKGAHDPRYIRPMTEADLVWFCETTIRPLLITVAPESVTPDQVARLVAAGIRVSVGHSDASFDAATALFEAGAQAATHLFNAMSPLGHREPGVVGAALAARNAWCGIIADGHHVHPAVIAAATRGKAGPGRLVAISDAMPTVGDAGDVFHLNGREVRRENGRLTLDDGTLAGSDLSMIGAVRYLAGPVGLPLEEALRMASLYPATMLGLESSHGSFAAGTRADFVHIDDDLEMRGTWIGGAKVA